MSDTIVEDRRATRAEVVAHRLKLLRLAERFGLTKLRVRDDGALLATVESPGYREISRFVAEASQEVGAFTMVIPDDTVTADLVAVAL